MGAAESGLRGSDPAIMSGTTYHSIVARDTAQIHAGDVNLYWEDTETRQQQRCLQVFKTSTYEEYKDRNPVRVQGTCQWVLTNPHFRKWRQSQHDDLLWISADPGCGKSVLAKSLVDLDLDDGGQSMVCYFFFKDNEEQDNLASALCALLHQVFTQRPDLIRHALPTWKKNGEMLRRETRELWHILQQLAADLTVPPIICVLDALDECREYDRRQLITFLCGSLQQSARSDSKNRLKFLVTSRPYDSVQRWFEQTTSRWPHIRLRGEDENEQIHQEINLVIKKQVHDLGEEFALSRGSDMVTSSMNAAKRGFLRLFHESGTGGTLLDKPGCFRTGVCLDVSNSDSDSDATSLQALAEAIVWNFPWE